MNRYLRIILILLFTGTSVSGQPTVQDILEAYKRTVSESQQVWAIKAESYTSHEGTINGFQPVKHWIKHEYYRHHNRLDISFTTGSCDDEGKPFSKNFSPELQRRAIIDEMAITYSSKDQHPPHQAVSAFDSTILKNYTLAQLQGGEALDGYFANDQRNLLTLLGESDDLHLRDSMEITSNHKCYVIEGKTNHGSYEAWLDPECGYLPRKVIVRKSLNDIYDSLPISEMPTLVYNSNPITLVGVDFTMDSVEIKKIGDSFLPTACQIKEVKSFSNGDIITISKIHKRTDIDLNPDFAAIGAFAPDLPDGTSVYNIDMPGVEFWWQNGRAVPYNDEIILEGILETVEQLSAEQAMQTSNIDVKKSSDSPKLTPKDKLESKRNLEDGTIPQERPLAQSQKTAPKKHLLRYSGYWLFLLVIVTFCLGCIAKWLTVRVRK